MADVLTVRVVSPAKTVYEGEAAGVVVPAWDGALGVLPGHAPLIALLGAGSLAVDVVGGGSRSWFVAGGVLKVEEDRVTVLTEFAGEEEPQELPEEAIFRPEDLEEWHSSPANPLV